jgi:hypothetical protein
MPGMDSADAEGILAFEACNQYNYCIKLALFAKRIDIVRCRWVGRPGVAERLVVPGKPGNAGGGKGPQFNTNARRGEGRGGWVTYQLRFVFGNCSGRCTRKRSQKPAIASMPCTTRCTGKTSWPMPMRSAAPHCRVTVKEEYPTHGLESACAANSLNGMARNHGVGGQVESHAAGLGKRLQGGNRQPRLSGARQLHGDAVASVVAQQA